MATVLAMTLLTAPDPCTLSPCVPLCGKRDCVLFLGNVSASSESIPRRGISDGTDNLIPCFQAHARRTYEVRFHLIREPGEPHQLHCYCRSEQYPVEVLSDLQVKCRDGESESDLEYLPDQTLRVVGDNGGSLTVVPDCPFEWPYERERLVNEDGTAPRSARQ